jgi:hypothetical protein
MELAQIPDMKRRMQMAELPDSTKVNLDNQGFCGLSDEMKARYALPLRFTPAVATALVVVGLVLQSPILLGSMALVTLSGVLFPRGMVLDLVYNLGVRHLFGAPALPPTPTPRRFSYGISTVWLAGSAVSYHYGLPVLGFILGAPVAIGGTILTVTLWCLGSWIYRLFFRNATNG